MNVKEFVSAMKIRPLMYMEELKTEYIFYLLKGFVGCNLSSDADKIFHSHFHRWVLDRANSKSIRKFEEKESYYWYNILNEITPNEQAAVELFFELSEDFFENYNI